MTAETRDPIHPPGTRVRSADTLDTHEARGYLVTAYRPPGEEGEVVRHHDGHGLCYSVRLSGGTIATYDHDELTAIAPALPPPMPASPAPVHSMMRELFDTFHAEGPDELLAMWNAMDAATAAQWERVARRALALGATFMTDDDRALQASIVERGGKP